MVLLLIIYSNYANANCQMFCRSEMVTHLASALHTSPTNLAVSDATTNTDCMAVSVYFTGKYKHDLAAVNVNFCKLQA